MGLSNNDLVCISHQLDLTKTHAQLCYNKCKTIWVCFKQARTSYFCDDWRSTSAATQGVCLPDFRFSASRNTWHVFSFRMDSHPTGDAFAVTLWPDLGRSQLAVSSGRLSMIFLPPSFLRLFSTTSMLTTVVKGRNH